jgi:hypothetical protein
MRALRWNCQSNGCFRNICPRLGVFDECFPSLIGMSDIDGAVEIGGRFLFLEWKSPGGSVATGQRIMFQQLTGLSHRVTVIVVHGDPKDMAVTAVQVFQGGKSGPPLSCDLAGLKARISTWARRADLARVRPSKRVRSDQSKARVLLASLAGSCHAAL